MAKNVRQLTEEIARPVAEGLGLLYVDTEYAKQGKDFVLTVYIDKKGGVTLEDCEAVSRAVEAALDEKDPIADSYCLCVSSPGLDRPLKTEGDFERSLGSAVDVKLYRPFEGKKEYTGTLTGYTKDSVTVETDGLEITFELKETAKINLHLDF
ncbi:MAG TPA: ribosome maturation factor RimP [Clostridiales bacterium]|nr:ribosome maturation factor RimP [Clostridiales bacterium]